MDEEEDKIAEAEAGQNQLPESEGTGQTAAPEAETEARPGPDSDSLDEDGDELFVEMSEEESKLAEANERYVRLLADFDNYRKRVRKEREILRYSANEEIILDLIPVIDNLERAIAAARSNDAESAGNSTASVLKGVELTLKLFANVLARHGVERISCLGEKFNPTRHEAVAQVDADDTEPETIVEEILPGYTINGKVIRAAKVNVARGAPAADQATEENE